MVYQNPVGQGGHCTEPGGSALTSPYTLTGSVTLYAQWTQIQVKPTIITNPLNQSIAQEDR